MTWDYCKFNCYFLKPASTSLADLLETLNRRRTVEAAMLSSVSCLTLKAPQVACLVPRQEVSSVVCLFIWRYAQQFGCNSKLVAWGTMLQTNFFATSYTTAFLFESVSMYLQVCYLHRLCGTTIICLTVINTPVSLFGSSIRGMMNLWWDLVVLCIFGIGTLEVHFVGGFCGK